MNKLYIIGNGFDLHHGLLTSYSDFEQYLKVNDVRLLDNLNKYYFLNNSKSLWSHFEENLANLDKEGLLDYLNEYYDDTSDWRRNAMGIETNIQLALLTSGLRNQFSEFILQAEVNEIDSNTIIEIDRDALFINFNYTNTLEKHYLISSDNILYIHGVASNKQEIILGHATDPEIFYDKKSEPKFPSEASKEIIEQWDDYMSDHHNPMYEDCVDAVNGYFLSSFKDTTKIIDEYSQYFSNLSDVEQIIIYGHSMSDIDMAYFEKISSIVKSDTQWLVTYYDSNKKEEIECVLEHLIISSENYQLIQW